jgi:hypothetical protein
MFEYEDRQGEYLIDGMDDFLRTLGEDVTVEFNQKLIDLRQGFIAVTALRTYDRRRRNVSRAEDIPPFARMRGSSE